jgi:hypothetical protein
VGGLNQSTSTSLNKFRTCPSVTLISELVVYGVIISTCFRVSGRSFCSVNSIRLALKSMGRDKAVAPTGCAATLLNGQTSYRGINILVGKKAQKPPSGDDLDTELVRIQAFIILDMCKLFALFKDEHSMDSHHDWAWLHECLDRSREHVPGIAPLEDEEAPENAAFRHTLAKVQKQSALAHVAGRPYGGIPFIMSSGDCMQLPPVGAKAHYDTSNPTDKNKACGIGRLEFKEFLHGSGPLDDAEAPSRSVTVVMDNVFWQNDGEFKKVLSEMWDGTVTYESAQLCMTRRLSVLPPQECMNLEMKALLTFEMSMGVNFDDV